jgi:hypothetical protein
MPSFKTLTDAELRILCSKFPRSRAEHYLRQHDITPETHPRQWMEMLRINEQSEEGRQILATALACRMRRRT